MTWSAQTVEPNHKSPSNLTQIGRFIAGIACPTIGLPEEDFKNII